MAKFNRQQFQHLYDVVALVTATVDPASLADGAGASTDVTVTGAALGDFVEVGPGVDVADVTVSAFVTAANTVTIRVQNESGGAVNLASSTWNILVKRPAAAAKQAAS